MTAPGDEPFPFADLALARRLERAEGRSGVDYVETRRRLCPDSGARWIEVAGTYAMYDGADSPVTQTFGLGMEQMPGGAEMDAIEAFYRECGAPVSHEVSPLADPALLALLSERGYRPIELTSLMFRPIRHDVRLTSARNERVRVRLVGEDEHELWARTAAEGWSESVELADQLPELMLVAAKRPGALLFLAELDGRAVAAGVSSLWDGVGQLGGASTIPAARRQGAQLALLEARLRHAAESGCDIATMGALPGSASQRNAERHGFRIAYTRIKWRLAARPG